MLDYAEIKLNTYSIKSLCVVIPCFKKCNKEKELPNEISYLYEDNETAVLFF
jgi:hypothetical protein